MFGALREAGKFITLGLEMGGCVAFGVLIGMWLDGVTGWRPWLTLLFIMFGIVAAFRVLLQRTGVLRRSTDEKTKED
jgi:ATP synthase protein I